MLRKLSTLGILALSASMALAADNTSLNTKDSRFLKDAAIGAMTEVQLGQTAQQQGSDEAVKQFGQRMVTDHGKELDQIKSLAQSKGVDLPMELDKKHKKLADKMAKLSGSDFDKIYASDMLKDHEKDLSDFQKEADKATDPDVKAFAAKTVPTLQEHLSLAQKLPGNENAAIAAREGRHHNPAQDQSNK